MNADPRERGEASIFEGSDAFYALLGHQAASKENYAILIELK